MAKTYSGGAQIKKVYAGDKKIKKVYLGSAMVYAAEQAVSTPSGVYVTDATGGGWSKRTYGGWFDVTDYDYLDVVWHGDYWRSSDVVYARTVLELQNASGTTVQSRGGNRGEGIPSVTYFTSTFDVRGLSGNYRLSFYGEARGGGIPCWAEAQSARLYS